MSDREMKRVNVNFSADAYGELIALAKQQNKSVSALLRDAIALEKWFAKTREEGGRVLVERDGEIREIITR